MLYTFTGFVRIYDIHRNGSKKLICLVGKHKNHCTHVVELKNNGTIGHIDIKLPDLQSVEGYVDDETGHMWL